MRRAGRGGRGSRRSRRMPRRCPSPSGWIRSVSPSRSGASAAAIETILPCRPCLHPEAAAAAWCPTFAPRPCHRLWALARANPCRTLRSRRRSRRRRRSHRRRRNRSSRRLYRTIPPSGSWSRRPPLRWWAPHKCALVEYSEKVHRCWPTDFNTLHNATAHCADHPTAKPFQHVRPRLPDDYRPYRCAPPRA